MFSNTSGPAIKLNREYNGICSIEFYQMGKILGAIAIDGLKKPRLYIDGSEEEFYRICYVPYNQNTPALDYSTLQALADALKPYLN
jgi:hypothetical protein